MNQNTFSMARQAYDAKDYQNALSLFTNCLQDGTPVQPGEAGLIYHQIGNCLVKLGNGGEAVNAYLQALNDAAYNAAGAVSYNLGTTYSSLRDFENAAKFFEKAVTDPGYPTPHKAYAGLGNAYMKLGKSAEAGIAFREAALDPSNPNPSKVLMSLGVCFMALNRPEDAITSYESALQFDMSSDLRNMVSANLGQAYVATGQMQKAVESFEEALADKSYFLSDSASVDYQRAIGAVSQGTMEMAPVDQQQPFEGVQSDFAGTEVMNGQYNGEPYVQGQETALMPQQQAPGGEGYHGQLGQDAFFNASEEEIENWARGQEKAARKKKHTGLKVFIVIIVILLLLVGGGAFAYTQGYGYPTQAGTVTTFFENPTADSDAFAGNLSDSEKKSISNLVACCPNVTVDAVERGMTESTVYATGTTSKGGEVHYEIGMVRNLAGWKIVSADIFFLSTGTSNDAASTQMSTSTSSSPKASSSANASASSSAAPSASPTATVTPSASAKPSSSPS